MAGWLLSELVEEPVVLSMDSRSQELGVGPERILMECLL